MLLSAIINNSVEIGCRGKKKADGNEQEKEARDREKADEENKKVSSSRGAFFSHTQRAIES